MICRDVRDRIDAYALGALEAGEAAEVGLHIAGCDECARLGDAAREVAGLLSLAAGLREPPPALKARILARALEPAAASREPWGDDGGGAIGAAAGGQRAGGWRGGRLALAAVVVALAVGVGGLGLSLALLGRVDDLEDRNDTLVRQVDQVSVGAEGMAQFAAMADDLDQQRAALAVLNAPDALRVRLDPSARASGAEAYYYWTPSSSSGVLLCSSLPPPPLGHTYEVWIERSGQRAHAGRLEVHSNRTALAIVSRGDRPITGMVVTIEPWGSTRPSGDTLLSTASNAPEPVH